MAIRNLIYAQGDFIDGNGPAISPNNAMFAHGDGTYEDILAFGTTARHLEAHLALLHESLKALAIEPPLLLFDEANVHQLITRLLNRNRIFDSAQVRLTVSRSTPPHAPGELVVQTRPLGYKHFPFDDSGLCLTAMPTPNKPINALSHIRGSHRLLEVMAQRYAQQHNADTCIIMNAQQRVAETTNGSLFIVRGNKLYTPSLAEGCCPNPMRELVCRVAPTLGFDVDNQVGFPIGPVQTAREVFVASPLGGIMWVKAFHEHRYYNDVSRALHHEISRLTFDS